MNNFRTSEQLGKFFQSYIESPCYVVWLKFSSNADNMDTVNFTFKTELDIILVHDAMKVIRSQFNKLGYEIDLDAADQPLLTKVDVQTTEDVFKQILIIEKLK